MLKGAVLRVCPLVGSRIDARGWRLATSDLVPERFRHGLGLHIRERMLPFAVVHLPDDEIDRAAQSRHLLRLALGELIELERVLELHLEFHHVERVRAEVVDEAGFVVNPVCGNAELRTDDLDDLLTHLVPRHPAILQIIPITHGPLPSHANITSENRRFPR